MKTLPESALQKIKNCNGEININVGSGTDTKPNVINYDKRTTVPELDINDLIQNIEEYFEKGTVTNIILFQVLEHFRRDEWRTVIATLCGLLKPNGRIHIRVPSIEDMVDLYHRKLMTAEMMFLTIYGMQDNYGEGMEMFDYHKSGVTIETITTELERYGCHVEEINHVYGIGMLHIVAQKNEK